MTGQSTQNGAADARPRSPVRRRALRLLGQLFLGERVTAAFCGAAAVVIAGVLLAQWRATDAAEEALLESPAKT